MGPLELLILLVLGGVIVLLVRGRRHFKRQLPQSKLLQYLVGLCFSGVVFQFIIGVRAESTLSDKIGNFFTDMMAPWMFGSFASQIPLVAFGSVAAAVVYTICVTPVKPGSAILAKLSLLVILALSLFTIWVTSSELSTPEQVAGFGAEVLVKKSIGLPIDLVISIVWVVVLLRAFSAINRESTRSEDRRSAVLDRHEPVRQQAGRAGAAIRDGLVCPKCKGTDLRRFKGILGTKKRLLVAFLLIWPSVLALVAITNKGSVADPGGLLGGVVFFMMPGVVCWRVLRRPLVRCADCGARLLTKDANAEAGILNKGKIKAGTGS